MTSTRLADRAVSRFFGLPPTTSYVVHRGLRVPMRDGVHLVTDHYAPETDRPSGTIWFADPMVGRSRSR